MRRYLPEVEDRLAVQIAKALATASRCIIYESDLMQVWLRSHPDREIAIQTFSQRHGWKLRTYREGRYAVFATSVDEPVARSHDLYPSEATLLAWKNGKKQHKSHKRHC